MSTQDALQSVVARPFVLTLGLLSASSATAFEAFSINTAMPAAARDLGGVADYGLVFSGFMLASFLGVIAGGSAADGGHARGAFAAGTLTFSAGLLWAGGASSMLGIVQGRLLQGLGGGAVNAVVYYVVRRAYPDRKRPRMLSLLATAWVLPGLAGPAVSGLVAEYASWRWVFWGLAPVMPAAAVLIVLALRALPAGRPATARGQTIHWIPLAIAVPVLIMAVLPRLGGARAVLFLTAVVLCLVTFRYTVPSGLLGGRSGVLTLILLNAVVSAAYYALETVLPLSMVALHAVPLARGGLVLAASAISWTAGTWFQAKLIRRVPPRRILAAGSLAVATGMTGAAVSAGTPAVPVVVIVAGWAVAALGMGLMTTSIALTVLEKTADPDAGHASAALQLSNMLGGACGTGLTGRLLPSGPHDTVTAASVLHVAILVAILGLLAVLLAIRPLPKTWT